MERKDNSHQTLFYRLPLVIYAIFIFVQSSFPSPKMVPTFAFSDKLFHFAGYALLGALAVRAFKREFSQSSKRRVIIYAALFATLYGAGDEFHQSFVAARTADVMDALSDCIGGAVGAWLFWRDIPFIDESPN